MITDASEVVRRLRDAIAAGEWTIDVEADEGTWRLALERARDLHHHLALMAPLPPVVVDHLLRKGNSHVRTLLAEHPDLTTAHFQRLLRNPDWSVRGQLLARRDLPDEVLSAMITADPSRRVRRAAAERRRGGDWLAVLTGGKASTTMGRERA